MLLLPDTEWSPTPVLNHLLLGEVTINDWMSDVEMSEL
jgi:hypothetical protein